MCFSVHGCLKGRGSVLLKGELSVSSSDTPSSQSDQVDKGTEKKVPDGLECLERAMVSTDASVTPVNVRLVRALKILKDRLGDKDFRG